MEHRPVSITLSSADDLKDVSFLGKKMHTYAVAWIDPYDRRSTTIDKAGGTRPVWNQTFSFSVPEAAFQQPRARLTVEIYNRGTFGNRFVGAVYVPLGDIVGAREEKSLTYQVKRRSGHVRGSLLLSVCVGEKTLVDSSRNHGTTSSGDDPVTAYPYGYDGGPAHGAYRPQYGNQGNWQQLPQYGNQGYPSQYPPPQYPSTYPPQGYSSQQNYPPSSRPGMGLGTGLVAGALGGLLVSDLIGDMSSSNDYGGYDGGFDGGF